MSLKIGLFVTSLERDYNKTPASYWIRILQMIEYYRLSGAEVYLNNYFKFYDVAIVFRKAKPKYFYIIRYLKLISKIVSFDTCINIFSTHEEINAKRLRYAFKIAKLTDVIICASPKIAEHARPYTKNVYVMEDPINIFHFKVQKANINFDSPIFGWAGVGAKSVFLNKYAREISGRIIIISEPQIKKFSLNFNYEYIQWNYKSFPKDLLKCDIALLPRVYNDPYNDSHSSFKALVFASLGIPVIASKVPSYLELSKYYDGIVFLEDYNYNIQNCINVLKTKDLSSERIREYYSCGNQAEGLLEYFEQLNVGKLGSKRLYTCQ